MSFCQFLLYYFLILVGVCFFSALAGICAVAGNRFMLQWQRKDE